MIKKFYLKLLTSLLLVALSVPLAQADELIVAGGTDTHKAVPFYGYYTDQSGVYAQMIYPADDLSAMEGKEINSITFESSTGIQFSGCTFTVTIGTTTTNAFSSTSRLSITDGKSGTITPAKNATQLTVTFDDPFVYEGGNIIIDTYVSVNTNYSGADSSDGATLFYGVNQLTNTAINSKGGSYGSAGIVQFLPKVTFDYTGEVQEYASKLTGVTDDSYDFGSLAVGASKTLNLTLRNTGANPFTPNVTITGSSFNTTYTAAELVSGATATIPVVFNPTSAGDFNGSISINCGSAGSYTINLTGSAVLEATLADGTEYNEYVPVYGYNHDSYNQTNQMVYPSSMLTSLQGKKLKSITFYPAEVASYYSTTKGINFKNGSATISLATIDAGTITYSASGNTRQQPDNFTIVGTISIPSTAQTDLTEWTIAFGEEGFVYNGGDLLVDVSTEKGSYGRTYFYGQTTESYTAIYNSSATALSGQKFLPKVKFEYEDATPQGPTITVDPATLTINAGLGETKTATFTVTGANLEDDITIAASEGFSVSPTTIAAADAANGVTVTVTYVAPATAETKTGTITLTSENAETKTVAITATAADITYDFTVEPESLDFGEVYVGQSKTLAVTVRNNSSENIQPVFTFNNNVFSVEDDSYPVYGDVSQNYNIVYTPAAAGTDNGTVTISVGRNSVVVNLTGNCVEQAAYDITSSAASGVHNFGDVFKDSYATWNVTLTNNGANAVTPVIEGLAAPFTAVNAPATLAAGQSATITFKFAPTAIQAYGPTSIVVKFAETTDFQFDYTFRGNGIENTGTLPPSTFDNYSYTWTDKDGNEHTSLVSEIATEPQQMIALLREVYTNKNFPGPYYRGYDANGNVETGYPVPYPAIGTVTRFGAFEDPTKYTYNDAYGWGIPHDETAYPFQLLYHNSSSHNHYKALNGDEYKPYEEGLTLLLVEMKDGANSSTVSREITSSNTLVNIFDKMFKSVRVITNSKKVTKNDVEGTLFKIDCDKMNRFFFLGKGRLRLMGENDVDNTHLLGRSNYFNDKDNQTSSTQSISNVANDGAPFFEMFEQFSPVSLIEGTESNDVYQQLVNMQSYAVEHDCVYIPWAPAQVSGGEAGHEFNMYGKESISDDCQDVRDLMFFVPDQRMKYWATRDRGANDKFVNYYEEGGYAPNMGLYVIRQKPITGEKIDGQDTYKLHLTWDSNLTDFVPSDKGVYYIYQVNENGTYTKVGETNSQTKELYLNVDMQEHGQQVTYVIQGQDNTGFLSLQMSNEESFIIPGTNPYAKFKLDPRADFYSRFNPEDEFNYYANGMELSGYVDATSDMYVGKTVYFYRKPVTITTEGTTTEGEWTKFAEVTPSSATSAGLATFDQRTLEQYQYGYKTNDPTLTIDNNVFTEFYDNFRADVSSNEHADLYKYIMVVDGTPAEIANKYHSNEISVKVYKTQMRNLTGTFDDDYVNNDVVRQVVDKNTQFDIDVEHSSKTEILRYGAYRWASDEEKAILASEDEDISPSGQASNQGEYYSVYMNGNSYIGDDVYVAQGETGQATFVDDVPATTNKADEYTYAPVIETFTGRADYNTYGAPMQTTATGKILVNVENAGKSGYTWEANGNTYRYYNVFVNVNTLDLPEGYEVAKVRAWRKIDARYLNEKLEAYAYRAVLDANGEFMFDDPTNVPSNDKLGSEPLEGSSAQNEMYRGTFGALDVSNGATVPMKFFVRIYFKKSNGSKAAGDEYYITEVEVDGELNDQIPTSIFGVESYKVVTGIKYYNMAGMESDVPFKGVNIEVTTYDDGSRTTRKIMK